ncbi:MAG TPA: LysR family transcriptional regulator [Advenella sp.]|nr:LysR family transcriptional regulator [Advenella sp.]
MPWEQNVMQPERVATDFQISLSSDLNRWRFFVVIAQLGSLTRAAAFLDSNQSLLSRQLNALERECGIRLFNRTGRGVALTETGTLIFDRVVALLKDAEQLDQRLQDYVKAPVGKVTFACFGSIGATLAARLYADLRKDAPGVSLCYMEGNVGQIEAWLADGRADIGIMYRYADVLPEHEFELAAVDSYLVGSAADPLTARAEVQFSELRDLSFVLPGAPNELRSTMESLARDIGFSIPVSMETNSLTLMKLMVAQKGLHTTLPIHSVLEDIADGRLQASRIVNPPIKRVVSMAISKSKGPSRTVSLVSTRLFDLARSILIER